MVRVALLEDSSMVWVLEAGLGAEGLVSGRTTSRLPHVTSLCLSCPIYKVWLIIAPASYGCSENETN